MNSAYHTFITVLAFTVSAVMFVATVTDFDLETTQQETHTND